MVYKLDDIPKLSSNEPWSAIGLQAVAAALVQVRERPAGGLVWDRGQSGATGPLDQQIPGTFTNLYLPLFPVLRFV